VNAAQEKPQGGGNRAGAHANVNEPAQCSDRRTTTEAQRQRILRALRHRPRTTDDLRKLGIFQAPAHTKKLRDRFGYAIATGRVTVVDRAGYSHPRAALYRLTAATIGGSE
jgi:hypothetical protein